MSQNYTLLHHKVTLLLTQKQLSKEDPKTEKSSINTSKNLSTMLEKIDIIHLWKVAGALHRPKGMHL
jgi:hypothetical protein